MLCWCDVAQESRAAHGSHRAADGAGDMVIAGSDISDQRSQHIEGRAHTQAFLHFHISSHLVEGHMPRSFHHHLYVVVPGPLGKFAQAHQFFDLAYVGGVRQTSGPAGVSQRDGHIVFFTDLQDLIKIFIEGILFPCHTHPGKNQASAPAYNIHFPFVLPDLLNRLAGDAAVERDKIHSVLSVQSDHVDEILGGQGSQVPLVMDDAVIDRNGSDHHRAFPGQFLAEGLGVAVAGKVHDGFSA